MISSVHRCKNTYAPKPAELESMWHRSVHLMLFLKTFGPHTLPESETEHLPPKIPSAVGFLSQLKRFTVLNRIDAFLAAAVMQ